MLLLPGKTILYPHITVFLAAVVFSGMFHRNCQGLFSIGPIDIHPIPIGLFLIILLILKNYVLGLGERHIDRNRTKITGGKEYRVQLNLFGGFLFLSE